MLTSSFFTYLFVHSNNHTANFPKPLRTHTNGAKHWDDCEAPVTNWMALLQWTWVSELIMFIDIVVCACSQHALGFKLLFLRSFVTSWKGYCETISCRSKSKLLLDYFMYWLWTNNAIVLFEKKWHDGPEWPTGHILWRYTIQADMLKVHPCDSQTRDNTTFVPRHRATFVPRHGESYHEPPSGDLLYPWKRSGRIPTRWLQLDGQDKDAGLERCGAGARCLHASGAQVWPVYWRWPLPIHRKSTYRKSSCSAALQKSTWMSTPCLRPSSRCSTPRTQATLWTSRAPSHGLTAG